MTLGGEIQPTVRESCREIGVEDSEETVATVDDHQVIYP